MIIQRLSQYSKSLIIAGMEASHDPDFHEQLLSDQDSLCNGFA